MCPRWEGIVLPQKCHSRPRGAGSGQGHVLSTAADCCRLLALVPAGHNSDGKFIARAQRIEYDCELVPRRVAIFIEKTKDGQILPVPNVVVRDVACGANHTVRLEGFSLVPCRGAGGRAVCLLGCPSTWLWPGWSWRPGTSRRPPTAVHQAVRCGAYCLP